MAIQHSVSVRNARLDAIETTIGTAPILRLRSGAKPANCAASRTGTVLASLTLPSDWLAAASSGTKSKSGTWQDLSADASGTAGHYEIVDSGGTVCHEQGTVTATGGGGDMELDNTVIAAGQSITVTTYGLTEGNA
jgi:hypothetical protein